MRDQRQTRLNRINRRGSEAIREAYVNGNISAKRADLLIHMEPGQAETELAAILAKQAKIAYRSTIATEVIRSHLRAGRCDLPGLEVDLRAALSTEQTVF